jgi:hypothetical protein
MKYALERCAKLRCVMRPRETDLLIWRSESLEVHAAHDFLFPPKIMSVLQLQLTNCFHKQLMHEPLPLISVLPPKLENSLGFFPRQLQKNQNFLLNL